MNRRDVVVRFFDQYRKHDIEGMLAFFSPRATLDYAPLGAPAPAATHGRMIWRALLEAFPDLSNTIDAIHADNAGRHATAEVTISGTQAQGFLGIRNRGRSFSLRHAFLFEFDAKGRIVRLAAFWDNVRFFEDLGKATIG